MRTRRAMNWLLAALAAAPLAGRADGDGWRFHHEAALLGGRHQLAGADVLPGERLQGALRLTFAPGALRGAPQGRAWGVHALVQGTVSEVGGGLALGAELVLRQPLGDRVQLEERLQALARLAGDRGHPPAELHPGLALVFSDRVSLRLEGEFSRDGRGGVGSGLFAGLALSGGGGTTLVVVGVAIAAVVLAAGASAF